MFMFSDGSIFQILWQKNISFTKVTYLGGALERVPVDSNGVVRDLLDGAR